MNFSLNTVRELLEVRLNRLYLQLLNVYELHCNVVCLLVVVFVVLYN